MNNEALSIEDMKEIFTIEDLRELLQRKILLAAHELIKPLPWKEGILNSDSDAVKNANINSGRAEYIQQFYEHDTLILGLIQKDIPVTYLNFESLSLLVSMLNKDLLNVSNL